QSLFQLKYSPASATDAGTAVGQAISFPSLRGGPWYSMIDFNGLNNTDGEGSRPQFFSITPVPTLTAPTAAGANVTMSLSATNGRTYGGYPWAIYVGQSLSISDPQPAPMPTHNESVLVVAVDHINKT